MKIMNDLADFAIIYMYLHRIQIVKVDDVEMLSVVNFEPLPLADRGLEFVEAHPLADGSIERLYKLKTCAFPIINPHRQLSYDAETNTYY